MGQCLKLICLYSLHSVYTVAVGSLHYCPRLVLFGNSVYWTPTSELLESMILPFHLIVISPQFPGSLPCQNLLPVSVSAVPTLSQSLLLILCLPPAFPLFCNG